MLLTPLGCTAESRSLYRRKNWKTGGPAIVMLFETDLYDPIFWLIPVCVGLIEGYWQSMQDRLGSTPFGRLTGTGDPYRTGMVD